MVGIILIVISFVFLFVALSIVKYYIKKELKREGCGLHVLYKYNVAELNNIRLFSLLFILASIATYISSSRFSDKFIVSFLEDMSVAFFTTGLFSILIGFSDFVNFVTKRLTDVVVKDDFLNTLSNPRKLELRRSIDSLLIGEKAIGDVTGLYAFWNERAQDVFCSAYRTNFVDEYKYYEHNEKFWKLVNDTSYVLHKGPVDGRDLTINLGSSWAYDENIELEEFLMSYKVYVGHDLLEFVWVDNIPLFSPNDRNINFKEKVSCDLTRENVNGVDKINLCAKLTVGDGSFKENDEVIVRLNKTQLSAKIDQSIYLRLGYPTKGISMSCSIISETNYIVDCTGFGFEQEEHIKNVGINSASVQIKEWLIPGHGAVISWVPVGSRK